MTLRHGFETIALAAAACAGALGCSSDAPVSAEADVLLERVGAAYQAIETAEFQGTVRRSVRGEDGSEVGSSRYEFTSRFRAPNLFRHDGGDAVVFGSNGSYVYFHEPAANVYGVGESPDETIEFDALPQQMLATLGTQDPALLLALAPDPAGALRGGGRIRRADDVEIDEKVHGVLVRTTPAGERMTLAVDPESGLIRRCAVEIPPDASARTTRVVVDYARVDTGAGTTADEFAWAPPRGARNIESEPGEGLIGRAAPEFSLQRLGGGRVTTAELRGNVVVLEFWAKWCGPCVKSLPHLAKLRDNLADPGVAFLAINLGDSREVVEEFVRTMGLDLPVLLDTEGETGGPYEADHIPHTVVIGRDGIVRNVFSGLPPERYGELREAVEAARRD